LSIVATLVALSASPLIAFSKAFISFAAIGLVGAGGATVGGLVGAGATTVGGLVGAGAATVGGL
jgi:hypothetical protein